MVALKWFLVVALLGITSLTRAEDATRQSEREEVYYRLETYSLPNELQLEVSGLALLPSGRVAIAIRKGEIWVLRNPDNPAEPEFSRIASGLHEPLGLAYHDGDLFTVQRTELTRLRDRNRDGVIDEYHTVAQGWGVTGAYHEYAYGPEFDREGNAWLTLNSSMGQQTRPDDNAWRGWSLRINPQREVQPVSGGFRSPSGIGRNQYGDIFATDQQGNWFPTCCLIHVRPGVFHGHADALKFCDLPGATFQLSEPLPQDVTVVEAAKQIEPYQLPAVWFPYRKMGMSATDVLCDETEGRFGPFSTQLFVGEFTQSFVFRVFLEQIEGVYQGGCVRFREGLQAAALRLGWTASGTLLIGQSNRGWNSLGPRSFGLQRLVPTGELPFEFLRLEAIPAGFRIRFTRPLDRDVAKAANRYQIKSYTYPYHSAYGGEELDVQQHSAEAVTLSSDGLSVELAVPGLRSGYVYEFDGSLLVSEDGTRLLHHQAFYTLNVIPSAGTP